MFWCQVRWRSQERNQTCTDSRAQLQALLYGYPCATGCGLVYILVQKENLEMRIMGIKAPHCGTMGNSLEGGRTVEKAGREGSLNTLTAQRNCRLVEEAQKSHRPGGRVGTDQREQTWISSPGGSLGRWGAASTGRDGLTEPRKRPRRPCKRAFFSGFWLVSLRRSRTHYIYRHWKSQP